MELNKNNLYIKNAKEIRNIAIEENVDVGVALDLYCLKNDIIYVPHNTEQKEFLNVCRKYTLDAIVKEM